jgi:hypothetical protein
LRRCWAHLWIDSTIIGRTADALSLIMDCRNVAASSSSKSIRNFFCNCNIFSTTHFRKEKKKENKSRKMQVLSKTNGQGCGKGALQGTYGKWCTIWAQVVGTKT